MFRNPITPQQTENARGPPYIGSRAPVNDTRQLVRFGIPPCWTSFAHSPRPPSLHIMLPHACGENVLCFVWITFPPHIYRSSPNTKFPSLFCTTVNKYQRPIEKKYVLRSWALSSVSSSTSRRIKLAPHQSRSLFSFPPRMLNKERERERGETCSTKNLSLSRITIFREIYLKSSSFFNRGKALC